MLKIFIDADACPVKDECYKVAARHGLKVLVVANQWLNLPTLPHLEMVVVDGGFDAADLWIVDHSKPHDIVITSDLLLADLCIKKQARVLNPKGHELNEDNIGSALAMRKLTENLRQTGEMVGGPRAFSKQDRSEFLRELENIIQREKPKADR